MAVVPAGLLERHGRWDPQLFRGEILRILEGSGTTSVYELGGSVVEGSRGWWGEDRAEKRVGVPLYRVSNVGELELRIEGEHCKSPVDSGIRCLQAGDVVVTKLGRVRASIASPNAFRHAVDGNCFLIRGLDQGEALWVTLCLNQPVLAGFLERKSGAAIIPRIQMRVLREAPLPPTPVEAGPLSERVLSCLDERIESTVKLTRLVENVRAFVAAQLPDDFAAAVASTPESGRWNYSFPPADILDTWVPGHVAGSRYRRLLRREAGWSRLTDLLAQTDVGGSRVGQRGEDIGVLRLSDVGEDLALPVTVSGGGGDWARRVFAAPVAENDVLVSTLVTSPRVAFAGVKPARPVCPVDHWCRLRFRETPGAWALVLDTPAVHAQLRRSAIGSAQQFVPAPMVRRLVVPDIPREVRVRWDSFLRQWQTRRRQLDEQWLGLVGECYRLLRETHRIYGPWTQPPELLNKAGVW